MRKRILQIFVGSILLIGIFCFAYGYLNVKKNSSSMADDTNLIKGFDKYTLVEIARKLSKNEYKAPQNITYGELKNLNYDQHRDIRFVRENGPWYNQKNPFEVQFFHLGSMFQVSVPINEIVEGKVRPIKYSSSFFDYGKNNLDRDLLKNVGYAGFRLHYPLNTSV